MSFAKLTQDLVPVAIDILGDLAVAVVYNSVSLGEYDPIEDTMPETLTTRNFNAVFARFSFNDAKADEEIVVDTDAKLVLAAQDFGIGEPAKDDYCTITDSRGNTKRWNVVKGKGVPGESAWIIHIRRT